MPAILNLGSRATVATLNKKLDDATVGNKDGLVGNEPGTVGEGKRAGAFDTNPILFKLRAFFEVGASKVDEEARLTQFLGAAEKAWDHKVSTLDKPAHVSAADWNAYLVDKAITLVRFGREPGEVTDAFVTARGSVDGHAIAERQVFTQTWKPTAPANGKTAVISPGFLETGRNYAEQIQLLNARGYEVVVMDHQWAGLSDGKQGGIDRGFGIARDLAAVTAKAAEGGNKVVVIGTSMGGGAGATGAVVMNSLDKIDLDGPRMPKDVDVVLQDPYYKRSDGIVNATLSGLGNVPVLRQVPLAAMGFPILSSSDVVLQKNAQHAATEHLKGRAQAFHASDEDLATMKKLLEDGARPSGHIEIIHADHDSLADYAETQEWAGLLGAHLETLHSDSHVIEENPAEQGALLDALKRLDAADP